MDKEQIEGKAKKFEGQLTGDPSREAEGRVQEKVAASKGAPKRMWEELKDRAGRAYNERARRKERERVTR